MRNFLLLLALSCSFFAQAQVSDNFLDGNFTTNPVWSGEDSAFTVVSGMLRSNKSTPNTTFYLSTASTTASNAQWEFWVNLQFNTSSFNFVDVYLISDRADLKSTTGNGYFIRLGGTADEVSLYKKVSGTITKIIDGTDGILNSSNSTLKVKVTRSAANLFTLSRDVGATGSYATEGNVTDNSFTASSFFGISISQSTASFIKKHFFDDISVGPIVVDKTPPTIISTTAIDASHVEVLFSEAMDSVSLKTAANYSINKGIGVISAATVAGNNAKAVLALANTLQENSYILTINNVKDRADNAIAAASTASFTYTPPYVPALRHIVMNEIFADPSPQIELPGTEFLELYNTYTKTINLAGWKYTDGTSTYSFGNDTIAANEYLILCVRPDTTNYKEYGRVIGLSTFPSLNNSGDKLSLKAANGMLIDSIAYTDKWYRDDVKKGGGYTLERIDPLSSCAGTSNFIASNDTVGGTPGKQNSVFRLQTDTTTLKITSILFTNDTLATLTFNKSIDSVSLATVGNFSIILPIDTLAVLTATAIEPYFAVSLRFQALPKNTPLVFRAQNMSYCGGMAPVSATITTQLAFVTIALGDIVINELMADPTPERSLPEKEFIELYNTKDTAISIKGWKLRHGSTTQTFGDDSIAAKGYVIVCARADTAEFKPFGKIAPISSISLTNAASILSLRTASNVLVDTLSYTDDWYRDGVKNDGGWTLERIDPASACTGAGNFIATTDTSGGTPGKQNSVCQINTDAVAFAVTKVKLLNDTTLFLTFNKALDSLSANSVANFTFITQGYTVDSVFSEAPYVATILIVSSSVPLNTPLSLQLANINYCGAASPVSITTTFTISKSLKASKKLIINEIFADPSPVLGLPEVEFVELYNRSDSAINLQGLVFSDPTSDGSIDTAVVIAAGEYVIICPEKDTALYSRFGKTVGLSPFPSLNNTEDVLNLADAEGNLIDVVAYTDDWYKDSEKKEGGYTLELINPLSHCNGIANWIGSTDEAGGTPGRKNSVYETMEDIEAPQFLDVTLIDSMRIALRFSKTLDVQAALNPARYRIEPAITIDSITVISPEFTSVRFVFAEPFARGITYTVFVDSLADCNGLLTQNGTRKDFARALAIAPGDLLINEILFNPKSDGVDFVEIYNTSQKVLDLKELNIADKNSKDEIGTIKKISDNQVLIQPGQYIVLCAEPDTLIENYYVPDPQFIVGTTLPAFNDDDDAVILLDKDTIVLDRFDYSDKMHFSLIDETEGVSLERLRFTEPTNTGNNWHSAASTAGYATPTYKNSQAFDGATVGDKITLSSEAFSPDNDGYNDVLTITYPAATAGEVINITLYTDKGYEVKHLVRNQLLGTNNVFVWDGTNEENAKATVGIYIIYVEVFDQKGKTERIQKSCVLAKKL